VRGASTAAEALGYDDPEERRSAFLAVTRNYHPNRFARRPDDVRQLASELFIALKEAHERGASEAADESLRMAKEKASSAKPVQGRSREKKPPSRPAPPASAARQELAERRREQLRQRLGGAAPAKKRSAQVQANTSTPKEREGSEDAARAAEELRFDVAREAMGRAEYDKAAAEFKALAVGRPAEKRYRLHMHYAQGLAYRDEGALDDARAEFKRALGLDANFQPALSAMSELGAGGKKKSGLFSKLFGK
jgi:tetratricopeptide (TPR) repeat protein